MGKMQLIIDQWSDEENEVEEVVLQRKRGIQRLSDTIEGGGLQQETIDVNHESILQSGNDIILPPSDSPSISEDPISLKIVKSENGRVGIIKENDEERKELYMERVFEIPPRYLFFCPNCRTNIRNAYIQHREWEPAITKAIMCPNCFVFVIPLLAPIPFGVPALVEEVASNKALEIVKSIVYGGLTELLASLIVVVSAIGTNATIFSSFDSEHYWTSFANLIGGLFIFVHNLQELKAKEPKKAENQTEAPVDRYMELLGHRKNFYVHAFIAILSFIVFGLVPPLVYGFSFSENGDKDFKNLGAVVVASLLFITMLSIAKAYTKKSNTFVEYFKTVIYDVSNGAVSSVLSYFQLTSMLSESQGCNKIHESEPDQSVEVSQSGAKDTTKSAVNIADDSGAQKVAIETNDNGIGSIDGNNVTSQDPKGRVAPRKKHFWGDWGVVGGANEASVPKQQETDSSSKDSDWRVIMAANNKQPEITLEVKVDGEYTDLLGGPGEEPVIDENTALIPSNVTSVASVDASICGGLKQEIIDVNLENILQSGNGYGIILPVSNSPIPEDPTSLNIDRLRCSSCFSFLIPSGTWLFPGLVTDADGVLNQQENVLPFIPSEVPAVIQEVARNKKMEIVKSIVYGGLTESLASLTVFTSAASADATILPPAVYGFSFHENGDKDFKKLIAVVVASLLCITLLSIAKAYTQKSNTFVAYFKTVIYYVSSGAVCLVLSYLAGDLVKKLLEKVSWLEPSSNFGLHVQGMSVQKTEWSSY
ncbi:hypothetical protein TanjilG_25317 [Lupinus angustifolius]|uniref:Uncharacterized protein n=1 Tax=Lupinus angustifolius TaxID=3871 RepID=A0A4P1RUW9_LUPAN|nr:hypothetical protein TanjilG_25317 [Lupinus angustifolius]